jgi:uncharacterized protein (TIGR02145 family)
MKIAFLAIIILLVAIFTFSCYKEKHVCGGVEHDPAVQKCDKDGSLLNLCGNEWYKPSLSEYCFEGRVKEKEVYVDPRDAREYKTVVIGTQTWMAENLNYAAYGSKCGGVTDGIYSNSFLEDVDTENCDKYGRLYDWSTALTVCPDGWHLPSDEEWTILTDYVGKDAAGTKLKATSGWILRTRCVPSGQPPPLGADYISCGINGTDDYGFSALPGGYGSSVSNLFYGFTHGYWWSTTEYSLSSAYNRNIMHDYIDYARKTHSLKTDFLSVRCIRD